MGSVFFSTVGGSLRNRILTLRSVVNNIGYKYKYAHLERIIFDHIQVRPTGNAQFALIANDIFWSNGQICLTFRRSPAHRRPVVQSRCSPTRAAEAGTR